MHSSGFAQPATRDSARCWSGVILWVSRVVCFMSVHVGSDACWGRNFSFDVRLGWRLTAGSKVERRLALAQVGIVIM